jgi:serine/threonine protein kinase
MILKIMSSVHTGNSNQKLHVFLVEKDEEIISLIRLMFSEIRECELEISRDYSEAWNRISSWEPDLILLSHRLLEQNGLNAVAEIHKQYPSICIIVFLRSDEESLAGEYIEAGVNGFGFTDKNFIAGLAPIVKKALIQVVERKSFLLPSLSGTTLFSGEEDLLHLSAFQAGEIVAQYRILEEVAEGGMGQIYRAEDQTLRRQVALKVLADSVTKNEKAKKRFLREARLAASLNHPNICRIYEVGDKDGHTFICMEFIEGVTLQKRIEFGPMEIHEILEIGIQIAEALNEAHKNKIIHRDIKSLNILLTERNQVKVLDFGLAKRLEAGSPFSTKITKTGEMMGTLYFMSPEQSLAKTVDHRSDIFSFGVVLYQMLTATLPFTANSLSEVLDSILNSDPVPIYRLNQKVPHSFSHVVHKMLNKDPLQRYQTMEQVWMRLRKIQEEISGQKQTAKESKLQRKMPLPLKRSIGPES